MNEQQYSAARGSTHYRNEAERPMVSRLKRIRLNMVALPQETLYVLQDRVIAELRAREGHALQVMSE